MAKKIENYRERMDAAKDKIGRNYGVIFKHMYPKKFKEIGYNKLMNITNHYINDLEVLELLEAIADKKG